MHHAPTRLRGHHLVCLHFFKGQGYTEGFVSNLGEVLDRLGSEPGIVTIGADDVCIACPTLLGDTCVHAEGSEAEIRRLDTLALRLLGMEPCDVFQWDEVRRRVAASLHEWERGACTGCEWSAACEPGKSELR